MRPLYLTLKDLRQFARDPKLFIFMLAMPLIFTLFMGYVMGPQGKGANLPSVAWVDLDTSTTSQGLAQLLQESGAIELVPKTASEAEAALRAGKVVATVTVPAGMDLALQQGEQARVKVAYTDSGSANAQLVGNALNNALARLTAVTRAALESSQEAVAWQPFADEASARSYFADGIERARLLWQAPALTLHSIVAHAETQKTGGFAQSSPGMLVQFTVFNLMNAGIVLVLERKSGSLRRLLTTPISRGEVILGKGLAIFVVALVQDLILVAVGQIAFGLPYFRQPLATLAMVVSFSLCISALGLLLGTLVNSENAVVAATLVAMFILTGMGGAWFPLDITGPTFAAIGHLLPSAWAMDGFQSILLRGAGLEGVAVAVGVMLAYGVGFAGLAIWRFRFE